MLPTWQVGDAAKGSGYGLLSQIEERSNYRRRKPGGGKGK